MVTTVVSKPVSQSEPAIFAALQRVKDSVGAVGKIERNEQQKFNFRGVDSVVNAVAPHFNREGITTCPKVISHVYDTVEVGRNKTVMGHVTLVVEYTFWALDGSSVISTVFAESMDAGDKAAAKAMSVAYRIALLQTLNLPTDEPDPDSVSYERAGGVPDENPVSAPKASASRSASARKPAVEEQPKDKLQVIADIAKAATIAELRNVWKDAGKLGILQDEAVNEKGEKVRVEDLLLARHDALSFSDGDESTS